MRMLPKFERTPRCDVMTIITCIHLIFIRYNVQYSIDVIIGMGTGTRCYCTE